MNSNTSENYLNQVLLLVQGLVLLRIFLEMVEIRGHQKDKEFVAMNLKQGLNLLLQLLALVPLLVSRDKSTTTILITDNSHRQRKGRIKWERPTPLLLHAVHR
jgi:hypothetical protein